MINFDEEIKKYKPMKDMDQIQEVILEEGTADMTDLMSEMIREAAKVRPAQD